MALAREDALGPAGEQGELSESLNRTVEDSLYRHHRARSDGAESQHVDMLGLAGLINALTRERMRRQSLSQAA